MAPGAGHCGLGGGLNGFHSANFGAPSPPSTDPTHDLFTALARWVEDGAAPSRVVATSYVGNDASKGIAMQRPLCPHPQKAWYNGGGDPKHCGQFYLRCREQVRQLAAGRGNRNDVQEMARAGLGRSPHLAFAVPG